MSNFSGRTTIGPSDTTLKSRDVRNCNAARVEVGPRQRPLNEARVREIANSFLQHGQLQPIGVRQGKGYVKLIFGRHRLAASLLLYEEGKIEAPMIWASFYDEEYPDDYIKMTELVENLHRQELSPAEREAHTTSYSGWLKKLKLVQSANQKKIGNQNAKRDKTQGSGKREPHDAVVVLPTVKEKLVAELGVDADTLDRRHANALKLAERTGLVIEGPRSLETMDADTLIRVGEAAMEAARAKKEKAREIGKPERLVDAIRPLKKDERVARLDVGQLPISLISWLERRINDKSLSLDVLKQTFAAMRELILKIEAA